METPFGITREEILKLAVEKLIDQDCNEESLNESAKRMIEKQIKELFSTTLKSKIDGMLTVEMERLMGEEICPVDIYGQPTGKPTTMRAVLAERGRVFWNESVDSDGRPSTYGGSPRHQHLFRKIVNDEFEKAVKQNIVNLVGSFKDALSANAAKITKDHIDSLIKVKSVGDR